MFQRKFSPKHTLHRIVHTKMIPRTGQTHITLQANSIFSLLQRLAAHSALPGKE